MYSATAFLSVRTSVTAKGDAVHDSASIEGIDDMLPSLIARSRVPSNNISKSKIRYKKISHDVHLFYRFT